MTAYSTCDFGFLVANAKRPLRLFALVCVSVSSATPAAIGVAAAPPPSISEDQAMRVVAASPLRELDRAWSQCIDEALFIARINAVADIAKIEELVSFSCEAYESRLTGELIKRHGYLRGTSVISSLKRSHRARYRALAAATVAKSSGYVAEVGDWYIDRSPSGNCRARITNNALVEPSGSWIVWDGRGWQILFQRDLPYADRYQDQNGRLDNVRLTVVGRDRSEKTFEHTLRFNVGRGFISWGTPLTDALLKELGGAQRVYFQTINGVEPQGGGAAIPGISSAFAVLIKCQAGQSAR